MSEKRLLIVSSHGLFREGLKRILADDIDLAIAEHTTSIAEAEERARKGQVDVVILDLRRGEDGQDSNAEAVSRLIHIPGLRLITVSLDTGDMRIYRHERVVEASVEDLVAALMD